MKYTLRNNVLRIAVFALSVLALSSGCGRKDDLNKARSVVETSLNSWKMAEDPNKLVTQGIEINDPDWQSGQQLLGYSVKSVSSQPQQGPRVVVVLNMQDKSGKKIDTEVAYEVILTDKAKIGRDVFHVPQ